MGYKPPPRTLVREGIIPAKSLVKSSRMEVGMTERC
jgi:hypothetical protein